MARPRENPNQAADVPVLVKLQRDIADALDLKRGQIPRSTYIRNLVRSDVAQHRHRRTQVDQRYDNMKLITRYRCSVPGCSHEWEE